MCYLCLYGPNFNEFKNHISFWNGKSYTCIACQNFLVICDGRYTKTFIVLLFIFLLCIIILFVCFILCFALLSFYVSLHYVLPALQFICACLIFMNMYVLLVSVCKCIVCFYVIFIYVGSKVHCELMLYCLCLADFK